MTIGASAAIQPTRINTFSDQVIGEYVKGDWSVMESFSPPTGNSTKAQIHDMWQWNNASGSERLRWQQDGILIAIYYQVTDYYVPVLFQSGQDNPLSGTRANFSQTDLVQIASGMMWYTDAKDEIMCMAKGQGVMNNSEGDYPIGNGQSCGSVFSANPN
jgi:hypothetical protein